MKSIASMRSSLFVTIVILTSLVSISSVTAANFRGLGGRYTIHATAVSADGSFVVGWVSTGGWTSGSRAFRWAIHPAAVNSEGKSDIFCLTSDKNGLKIEISVGSA